MRLTPGSGPLPAQASDMALNGKRKKVASVPKLPLQWPVGAKNRFDLFDAWHDVAMQIVHKAQGDFRLLAVMKNVIMWKNGVITLTNAELSQRAGRCALKTISRGVKLYSDLGIIAVDMGWIKKRDGSFLRTRTIRLALPEVLDSDIFLPSDQPFHMDTRGPDYDADTRGPD